MTHLGLPAFTFRFFVTLGVVGVVLAALVRFFAFLTRFRGAVGSSLTVPTEFSFSEETTSIASPMYTPAVGLVAAIAKACLREAARSVCGLRA